MSQVLTKGKLFEKNTTKCRKHQRNLIIREYRISLDVKVWTMLFLTPIPIQYNFDGYVINIGNTGINAEDSESKIIHASGIVVKKFCEKPSNWRSIQTLEEFLIKNKVIAISEIDTRCKEMFKEDENITENQAMAQLKSLEKDIVRTAILKDKKRIDGYRITWKIFGNCWTWKYWKNFIYLLIESEVSACFLNL